GLEMRSARARAICRAAGCLVDEEAQTVRMGRDVIAAYRALAPSRFTLHARNPARSLDIGGDGGSHVTTVHGAPHVSDAEGGRRYGTLADLRDILKVTHTLGVVHYRPGVVVEPVDVPVPVRHLKIYRTQVVVSDTLWCARGLGRLPAEDAIRISAIEHGTTPEALAARPTLMTVTNVNSPRRVDEEILDNIMVMADHGQCVCVTPFTLMGAMAPVTLAGALAQQTAEALGIIAFVQMVRPGTPCVLGTFTSNVDMRTGSPAFGTPEFVQATLGGAQIARALGLPSRSGAPSASPAPDAQAVYETSFSLWAALMGHTHLVSHALGWIEGGLTASLEKIIIDAEMLRSWASVIRPRRIDDDELALDAILTTPAGGHYFGAAHTMARYETAFWRPILSDWSNFENWRDAGSRDATRRALEVYRRTLESYEAPPLDQAITEAVDAYIARRKAELVS
ncbi:MAG: methyltransferase, partial [Alphaproteobacteria bacterium]|nr:methyltransferase [Alphaproteobacteria bacterium]